MSLSRILTHAEPGDPGAGEAALALATALEARVEALVFAAEVIGNRPEADEAAALRDFTARAAARGVACHAHGRRSMAEGLGSELAARLRLGGLAVLDWPAPALPGHRMMATAVVFGSGRPVILAPPGAMAGLPGRILVGWDDSPASVRAVHAAMPLLRRAEAVVVACAATPGKEEHDPGPLAESLREQGIAAQAAVELRGGRPVLATLREAAARHGVGLLVAGAARHAPVHDMLFGSLTHDVMTGQAGMPVLLMA
ncbi:universal stress protein [Roseococcus sp. DSY-14]|uniref:universal stress protein n=1 Tax=Roseococcus sp. DSY-14 TaxID=3369650 RepID=UPI00387B8972